MSDGPLISFSLIEISLEGAPEIMRELARLFEVIWLKSPPLAAFATLMPFVLSGYLIYTWGSVRRAEKAADANVERAWRSHKKAKTTSRKRKDR